MSQSNISMQTLEMTWVVPNTGSYYCDSQLRCFHEGYQGRSWDVLGLDPRIQHCTWDDPGMYQDRETMDLAILSIQRYEG